jgi:hypothetical protein
LLELIHQITRELYTHLPNALGYRADSIGRRNIR